LFIILNIRLKRYGHIASSSRRLAHLFVWSRLHSCA